MIKPSPSSSLIFAITIVAACIPSLCFVLGKARVATFNASLNRDTNGTLYQELLAGNATNQAAIIARIIQINNPDILLINEFDYDPRNLALFQQNFLSKSFSGSTPINYPFSYIAPSNTGIPTGFDLNNNNVTGGADDAFGFGNFPGHFGMAVYSKFPIVAANIRTFQNFLWKDMPNNLIPQPFYSPEEVAILRLSSKSHWDIPINVNGAIVHFLVSHPTPPVFDGPEDRNGRRNYDEIRFWADYIRGLNYMYDDKGVAGGLPAGRSFIIAGDQNSDPFDGDSIKGSAQLLLEHPLINNSTPPSSLGAVQQATLQGMNNVGQKGNPAVDTADFADFGTNPGNLRVDYVLPSKDLLIESSRVFWPLNDDPLWAPLVGNFPFPSSDHKLVYIDIIEPEQPSQSPSAAPKKTPIRAPVVAPVPVPVPVTAPSNATAPVAAPTNATAPAAAPVVAPVVAPVTPPVPVPVPVPVRAPEAAPVKAPVKVPVVAPVAVPVQPPTTAPTTKTPTAAPVREPCGLLNLNIFCPFTQCGLIGRLFGFCD